MTLLPLFIVIGVMIGSFLPNHRHDPDFKDYVNEYLTIVNTICESEQLNYPNYTRMNYVQKFKDKNVVAQCQRFMDGSWEIQVLEPHWKKVTLDNRRALIFHELSHCILLKGHVDSGLNYMYPILIDIEQSIINDQVLEDAWTLCGKK